MIQELHAALKRYGGGVAPTAGSSLAWSAAKVFELAARNVGDTPGAAAILDGLWSIKNNDFGGLTARSPSPGTSRPRPGCASGRPWCARGSGSVGTSGSARDGTVLLEAVVLLRETQALNRFVLSAGGEGAGCQSGRGGSL